jgi:hypothetical protein
LFQITSEYKDASLYTTSHLLIALKADPAYSFENRESLEVNDLFLLD